MRSGRSRPGASAHRRTRRPRSPPRVPRRAGPPGRPGPARGRARRAGSAPRASSRAASPTTLNRSCLLLRVISAAAWPADVGDTVGLDLADVDRLLLVGLADAHVGKEIGPVGQQLAVKPGVKLTD